MPLGCLVQVALRMWTFWHARAPAALPDEAGYLLAARRLAGGPGGDMSHATFYQGGYPLLLSPVFRLTTDPATAYRLVAGIGAVAGAMVFPLSVAVLRRLGVRPPAALVIAFAVAALPANVFFGAWALTDAILPAVVACWSLALLRFADTGGWRAGCAAGLTAAYAYAVHSRGSVIMLAHAGAVGLLLARGWVPRRHAALAAGVTAAGWLAANRLNAFVRHALYPDGPRDLQADLWSRLTSAGGLLRTLSGACGQLWYLVVATYGLAGLGLVAAAAQVASRRADRSLRLAAATGIAVTVGIAVASTAALPDEHRVGNYVYGRYLACVAVPFSLAGAAMLVRAGRRIVAGATLITALVVAGTSLAVVGYAGPHLRRDTFIGFDFPEISYLTANWRSLDMRTASVVSAAIAVSVLLLRRWPAFAMVPVLLVNGGFALYMAHTFFVRPGTGARPAVTGGGGVAAARDTDWRTVMSLRYRVGWTTVAWLAPAGPPPGTCTVITAWRGGPASAAWPGRPPGWSVADQEPGGWVAWRRTDCAQR